ncbi:MAG TPA: hypothetical protein VI750_10015, partial [Pyrinomonadaceae bacterium]|nr:hypothetical protein [Pyrinomonadaceae bacterium]
ARQENATNGSWWMVQIVSTNREQRRAKRMPPTAVGGWFRSFLQTERPAARPENATNGTVGFSQSLSALT